MSNGTSDINEFWRELVDQHGCQIDIGASFEDLIDGNWKAKPQFLKGIGPPTNPPPTYELREQRIKRTILRRENGNHYRVIIQEVYYVEVPEVVEL